MNTGLTALMVFCIIESVFIALKIYEREYEPIRRHRLDRKRKKMRTKNDNIRPKALSTHTSTIIVDVPKNHANVKLKRKIRKYERKKCANHMTCTSSQELFRFVFIFFSL